MMVDNDDFDGLSLFGTSELEQSRLQALDLFDRCLAESNFAPIVAFVERQVRSNPPHLPLLRQFVEGLHQRLLSLRAYYYDIRQQVIRTLADDYGVDIAPLFAAQAYHHMDAKHVMNYVRQRGKALSTEDVLMLGKLLEASIQTSAHLNTQIQQISELQQLVLDWLSALNATVGRRYWSESESDTPIQ